MTKHMVQNLTPISHLFAAHRRADDIVAITAGRRIEWATFEHDVANLAARLANTEGNRWLIAEADAYSLAVGVVAAFQADCLPMLPANLQPGHLTDLSTTAHGVISSIERPGPMPWIKTFEKDYSAVVSSLRTLDPNSVEIILHTSGTTGVPTAIYKPLRCLEAEIVSAAKILTPTPGLVNHATVPPYHIYGLIYRVLMSLSANAPFSADTISYPEELVSAIKRESGGMLISSPAFLKRALSVLDLDRLKTLLGPVMSSGGLLPPTVAAAYNAVLIHPITEIYGSTETGGIAVRTVTDADAPTPWRPLSGVKVRLDSKHDVLSIRSPMLTDESWALTNDRVNLLSDGLFELKGRADRVVKIEEKRVSLPEVEQRLTDCSTVMAARVIPLTGDDGERQILGAVIEPSEAGGDMITNRGKAGLRKVCRSALKQYLPAVVVPRKWRFVIRIPEDHRGKTSNEALVALFEKQQGRRITPIVEGRQEREDGVTIHLRLPKDLFYFDGHFEGFPILAGVVQINWAIEFAIEYFSIPSGFRRLEALKFYKVLLAGDAPRLELNYQQNTGRLNFEYGIRDTKHSSGHIIFDKPQ